MKVLILTNLFPYVGNELRGIFITNRLRHYNTFGIEYDTIALVNLDDVILRKLKSLLKITSSNVLAEADLVKYNPIYIRRNVFDVLLEKLTISPRHVQKAKRFVQKIERIFNIDEYDLIHAHGMYLVAAGVVARLLAEKHGKPYIITAHGSDINILMKRRKKEYINTLEKASKVIFVTNALLEKAKSYGYSGENAVVIPNGYDPTIFKPQDKNEVRKQLGIYAERCKYVGFVGNLIEIKRADKLIEIFERIRERVENVKFIVVGDGYLRKKMEQEAKERGLEVLFTGRLSQKEVALYMNAMDVMVLPSRKEGFGAVVIEAQACGTCVVGSNNGGIPEAIGFKEYVVEEGKDFEVRFADKVVEVLKNGYDPDRLIQRTKEYTWEKIVEKEIKIYGEIVTKRNVNV